MPALIVDVQTKPGGLVPPVSTLKVDVLAPGAAGETWDEALDALETAAGDAPLTPEDMETWHRLEAHIKTILPDVELFSSEDTRELSDEATGLQLGMYSGQISLSVPYWYEGEEADEMTETLRAVARTVEQSTGLVAFDPQANQPFLGGGDAIASQTLEDVHAFVARDIESGSATAVEAPPQSPAKPSLWRRLFRS